MNNLDKKILRSANKYAEGVIFRKKSGLVTDYFSFVKDFVSNNHEIISWDKLDDPQRNIAVISFSNHDFILWAHNNGLKAEGFVTSKRFMIGNTTFFNISDPCDSISMVFDAYAETEQAKKNKNYDRIKLYVRGRLK